MDSKEVRKFVKVIFCRVLVVKEWGKYEGERYLNDRRGDLSIVFNYGSGVSGVGE